MFKFKIVALSSPKGILVLLIEDVIGNKAKPIPQFTYWYKTLIYSIITSLIWKIITILLCTNNLILTYDVLE